MFHKGQQVTMDIKVKGKIVPDKKLGNKVVWTDKPLEQRFWEKVDKRGKYECWEWQAGKSKKGYGYVQNNRKRGKLLSAHRVSWELHNGKIPKGMLICHHCDNPPCVNPNHLFLGTQKDNIRDAVKKGRKKYIGEGNGRAILTKEDVLLIRELYKQPDLTLIQLAKSFNVSRGCITGIVYKKTWKHI